MFDLFRAKLNSHYYFACRLLYRFKLFDLGFEFWIIFVKSKYLYCYTSCDYGSVKYNIYKFIKNQRG